MLRATHRVAEGARWALSNRLDDLLGGLTVGVYPWFLFQLEHRGEVVGAESGMGADTPIIMNGDIAGYLTSGMYGHSLGGAIGMGYVNRPNLGAEELASAEIEIEVAQTRFPARASLKAFYDPTGERMKL